MKTDEALKDAGLLVGRAALGASIAAHGAQKLFGAFGGPGLQKAGAGFEALGFRPGTDYARMAALTELSAGVLLILGAGGPAGPAMLASAMGVAGESTHRKNGYFAQQQGIELNVMYALGALLLANTGNGRYSIDGLLGLDRKLGATAGWLAMGIAAGAAYAVLSRRTVPEAQPPQIRVETGSTEPAGRQA